ncbi:MAG: sugar transferase [Rhizobium sp.]|nr:sugar transferase [Rhizobium sp.]
MVDVMDMPESSLRTRIQRAGHANGLDMVSELQGENPTIPALRLFTKRMADLVVAAFALAALLPVLIACAIAIRWESPGPVFFRQIRWGQGGRKITVYKFRSMHTDMCDASGVNQTVAGDARITRVGAFLRKSNFDELPQLINVLKGDMSLVGPRCHAVGMKAAGVLYEELVPNYHLRHAMKPGITGLAQMRGLRGPTDTAARSRARIAADLYYIQNYSVMLDFKIMLGTLKNEVFRGSGF